jgi:hypothetical protein
MTDKTSSAFRMSYRVAIDVRAGADTIWARLTNADDYPKWNSTVEKIAGPIALGQKLAIQVPIAPGRTFSPKVVALEAQRRMVWQDGFFPMFQGTRTYTLSPGEKGVTRFEMEEVFRGAMLPMIRGSLPDFGPVFDQFAADLKKACERS